MRRFPAIVMAALCALVTPAAAEEPFKHGGLYAGVSAGYSTTALTTEGVDIAGQGLFGGAFLGWGFVSDGLYFGLEVDGMLRDIKPSIGDGATTIKFSNDWVATARARIGVPIGPALLYATAGPAFTESKLSVTSIGSDSQFVVGLAAGAGAEMLILPNMALRVEAMHFAFPAEKFSIEGVEASIKQGETVARAGVVFRLN